MIDRLVHHAEILALKGDSYRLKDRDLARPPRLRFGARRAGRLLVNRAGEDRGAEGRDDEAAQRGGDDGGALRAVRTSSRRPSVTTAAGTPS
jgi:hypothetical protein